MVEKQRHWLLTLWLVILICFAVMKAWYSFVYMPIDIHARFPNVSSWYAYGLGIIALATILCVYGIFKWSIWGFWGYCLFKIIELYLKLTFSVEKNIAVIVISQIALVLILFALLNIGGEKKAWKQLTY